MYAVTVHVNLTCSSASKSWLYWAISSTGLFFSRLRHSSQVPRPAMNIPMSGRNTRMPFPTSAPITLMAEETLGHELHTQKLWLGHHDQWWPYILPYIIPISSAKKTFLEYQYIIGNSQIMCSKGTNTQMTFFFLRKACQVHSAKVVYPHRIPCKWEVFTWASNQIWCLWDKQKPPTSALQRSFHSSLVTAWSAFWRVN